MQLSDDVKPKTRAFMSRYFQNCDLEDHDDIFALGLANSLFAMQLVMFVEKTFQVTVEDDDLKLDNFRSIDAIANLVGRRSA